MYKAQVHCSICVHNIMYLDIGTLHFVRGKVGTNDRQSQSLEARRASSRA